MEAISGWQVKYTACEEPQAPQLLAFAKWLLCIFFVVLPTMNIYVPIAGQKH
jgi:hypothetical protein